MPVTARGGGGVQRATGTIVLASDGKIGVLIKAPMKIRSSIGWHLPF